MRIGLQSWGTEGDLRPFLALGRALQARGHAVRLAFTGVEGKDFSALAADAGVPTDFVDDGWFVAHRDELARRARASFRLGGPRKQFELILKDLMDPVTDAMLAAARGLAADCDVVAGHFLAYTAAVAAEERRRPYALLALQPVFGSAEYPPAGAPTLGPWFHRFAWRLADSVMRSALLARANAARVRCGVPPSRRFAPVDLGTPRRVLVAVSPTLFPRPSDWDARIEVCGFLALAERAATWQPAPALEAFLAAGPPVFLSFGSMFGLDDRQTAESVACFADAVARAGTRGIIQAPAAVIARAPRGDHLCYVARAPHAALFPRCAAIVHHGGAGTMQSAVLAGRGSIVVPHAADQFYWADLLHARGVAAKPLKRARLTADRLARRIRAVLDDATIAPRAATLARGIAAENGPERAAELIERAGAG